MSRRTTAGVPRSPRLIRSNSPASAASPHEIVRTTSPWKSTNRATRSATSSPHPSNTDRSRSITRPRSSSSAPKDADDMTMNINKIPISKISSYMSPQRTLTSAQIRSENGCDNNVLRKSSPHNMVMKRVKSLTGSPSAWALSPGRPLHCSPSTRPESPKPKVVLLGSSRRSSNGGVSGVLKYFGKQKKVSAEQEEEFHRYRVMYNKLMQWRFANAKAEAAIATVRSKAEGKMFGVWLQVFRMRYAITEKRIRGQRLNQKIKLLDIVCPQIEQLNQWEILEKRNCEAVGRVTRKLSALSTQIPLVHGAQVQLVSLFESMGLAIEVMGDIEDTIINFHFQVQEICYLLRELILILGKQRQSFKELDEVIKALVILEDHEQSLRAYLMQETTEQRKIKENQSNCKYHFIHSFQSKKLNVLHSILNVS